MKNIFRIILVLCSLSLFANTCFAVSGVSDDILVDSTLNATVNGDAVCLPRQSEDFVFVLHAANTTGTLPTLDVKIQHSADQSIWFDLDTPYTQVTTVTSNQIKHINSATTHVLRCVRAVATLGGTGSPSYDASVKVLYRIRN